LGPQFGIPIWDPDLRPRFGTPILNPDLGPHLGRPFGTPIWDTPHLGPQFGTPTWDPNAISKIIQTSSDMNEIIQAPCDAGYVQSCTGFILFAFSSKFSTMEPYLFNKVLYQNASKRDIQHIRPFAQSAHATLHSALTQPLAAPL
jgi:hypothetical protein